MHGMKRRGSPQADKNLCRNFKYVSYDKTGVGLVCDGDLSVYLQKLVQMRIHRILGKSVGGCRNLL
jgi:hypothetical protein